MNRNPIPVKEAVERVISATKRLPNETVPLEKANGRILAEPIVAEHDVPPFNRSAFDGYAIRAEDSQSASPENPAHFHVIGEIAAGDVAERPIERSEAYRIMTGGQLPDGADAIVMLEDTEPTKDGFMITKPFRTNDNISFQGEDAKKGDEQIPKGSLIHAGTVALLATFGYANVKVAKQPVVSLLATGTELLDVADPLEPGKIRNSNGPMLQAQLDRLGLTCKSFRMMEDDLERCTAVVKEAVEQSDIVITTGGVSVGDYDYLPQIYDRLGAKVLFNKVMMRPGSVTTVAKIDDTLLFGLSGNPSACFTGFELFTRPAIYKMMGCHTPYLPRMKAVLGEDFPKNNPFTRFIRASWEMTADGPVASPAGFNKSSAVSSIARGNCIIVLPSGSGGYKKGMEVDILLLGQEQGVTTWEL